MDSRALSPRETAAESDEVPRVLRRESVAPIPLRRLQTGIDAWLVETEYNDRSSDTLSSRRFITGKLLWFLRDREWDQCGPDELRAFFVYVQGGHNDPRGRWGNGETVGQAARAGRKTSKGTVKTYHGQLRTLFRWMVAEGYADESPIEVLPKPKAPADQVAPFTEEQAAALFEAAKRSAYPRRDTALLGLLVDTGLRADELCRLRFEDVDLHGRRLTVRHGKGSKSRVLPMSADCVRALIRYLSEDGGREAPDPLFRSERGRDIGGPLTPSGLLQLLRRLGDAAGIKGVRCSPHTCRHTFATFHLRSGGNIYTLQQMLGHTTLEMCKTYLQVAQADIERQHRQSSPLQYLRGRKRGQ